MKVSRACDSSQLGREFYRAIDLVVFGTVTDEERNRRALQLWGEGSETKSYHIYYDLESEEYSLLPIPFGSVPDEESILCSKRDVTSHLRKELLDIGIKNKKMLVDITGISQPAIFFLLKLLYEDEDLRPSNLFVAYTEPLRYKAKVFPSSEDVFELTERFIGLKALPGFIRKPEREKNQLLVLLIGFEGKRAKYVCETLEIPARDMRIVLGFPGFRPGWQYLAYGSNQSMLEYFQAYNFLSLAAANNPFDAYNSLLELHTEQVKSGIETRITVAPVGTKPHALGAAMFALHYSSITRLVYDFPVKSRRLRSEGYGTTWIYNFSALVRESPPS